MTSTTIDIYEDDAGQIYLSRGGKTWKLGRVTREMEGMAANDALTWNIGDWEPLNKPEPDAILLELNHIATWSPGELTIYTMPTTSEPVAGAGGKRYLGVAFND